MTAKTRTPVKAIRAKCLDCCCWQVKEVRLCTMTDCPLYPFRMGKNPNRRRVDDQSIASAETREKTRDRTGILAQKKERGTAL